MAEGENCEEDFDCQTHLTCISNKCAAWFSGVEDDVCTIQPSGATYECESNYCNSDNKCATTLPENNSTGECSADSDCTTTVSGVTGTCSCAITETNGSYCSAQPGDDSVKSGYSLVTTYMKPFVTVTTSC